MMPMESLHAGAIDSDSGEAHVKSTYINCDPPADSPRRRPPLPPPAVPPLRRLDPQGD